MAASQYKHLYNLAEWKRLRVRAFVRDKYICQRCARPHLCSGKYPAQDSPVANHRVAHRGDLALFLDLGNLETVCKKVHDGLIQAEEQASLQTRGSWGD